MTEVTPLAISPEKIQAAVNQALETAKAKAAEREIQKAAEKEKKDAERAANKQAKIDAKAAAKATAKAEKEAAKEAAKAERQAARGTNDMPEQNGVKRPRAETMCGKVWQIADSASAVMGSPVPLNVLLELTNAESLNEGNVKTAYSRWRKHHGVTGRVTVETQA